MFSIIIFGFVSSFQFNIFLSFFSIRHELFWLYFIMFIKQSCMQQFQYIGFYHALLLPDKRFRLVHFAVTFWELANYRKPVKIGNCLKFKIQVVWDCSNIYSKLTYRHRCAIFFMSLLKIWTSSSSVTDKFIVKKLNCQFYRWLPLL